MKGQHKIIFTGPVGAGKTTAIGSISDIEPVTTEELATDETKDKKELTTVAMDYGRMRLDNDEVLHLYGTPGQPRFDFMWDILSTEMHAFILLVDSSDRQSLMPAKQLIRTFGRKGNVPYLVVANKQDIDNALSTDEIAKRLGLDEEKPVIPCVAIDRDSVLNVLKELHRLIQPQ